MSAGISNKENEYRAYFTLVGEFDPSTITSELGLQPSRSWAKGDPGPKGIVRTFSRWSLDSRLSTTEYVEQHVLDVLEQLRPVSENVLRLRTNYDAWIQIVAYFLIGQAGVNLSSSVVEGVSRLKLGLDFDPYDLLSNEEDL